MEVADVDALALVGGGLLVEAVPAAATCAAHKLFPFSFLPKSLEKVTSSWSPGTPIAHIYGVFQQVRGKWYLCKPSQRMGDASVQSAWPVWSVARQRPPPLPFGLQIWHSSSHSNVHSDVCSGRAQRGM